VNILQVTVPKANNRAKRKGDSKQSDGEELSKSERTNLNEMRDRLGIGRQEERGSYRYRPDRAAKAVLIRSRQSSSLSRVESIEDADVKWNELRRM
jgi:hypothetical protein